MILTIWNYLKQFGRIKYGLGWIKTLKRNLSFKKCNYFKRFGTILGILWRYCMILKIFCIFQTILNDCLIISNDSDTLEHSLKNKNDLRRFGAWIIMTSLPMYKIVAYKNSRLAYNPSYNALSMLFMTILSCDHIVNQQSNLLYCTWAKQYMCKMVIIS